MKIDRNTRWYTQSAQYIMIKDLGDAHLANILDALITNTLTLPRQDQFIRALRAEARRRGLDHRFLARAPMPFVGPKGKWMLWNPRIGVSIVVSDRKARI